MVHLSTNDKGPVPRQGTGPGCSDNREEVRNHTQRIPSVTITQAHRQLLLDSAISNDVIDAAVAAGQIRSDETGMRFAWSDGVAAPVWQRRPDQPELDADGKPMKYVFRKGAQVPFNQLRDGDTYRSVLLVEGTKQQWSALSHAPADFAVYGMSGCWGFRKADLSVFDGRDLFVLLDADFASNVKVYAAAEELMTQAKRHGAASVRFVATTGTGKEGVDDVLAGFPSDRRAHMLKLWLSQATDKLPKKPRAKRPTPDAVDAEAVSLFRQRDKPLAFQPKDAADKIREQFPAAATAEDTVALYRDGVYSVDHNAFRATVVGMLGNFYTQGHLKTALDVMLGILHAEGAVLPERMGQPLLNCPNGMVDLRTGTLLEHDPKYLSYVQVTAEYAPQMATPVYEAWLREALRQPGHTDAELDALVADIEETAGTMLDPSKTASKALFLFGPSRSGKSTFLRLLKAIAGAVNTSAVTLHALGTDTFATANLYGKMLNVAADLSNRHVEDLSNFKMLTGEDAIQANRKYGAQFSFTNQALFAFSANELPTVTEASRAYAERMKPFEFPNSFAGREDKTLEDKLMAELPGILARWVKAYGRFLTRGGYGPTDARTLSKFEAKSDRVVQFFQDMCTVTPAGHGDRLADTEATGRRDAAVAFNAWAERNGGSKMGERAFFQRFAQISGVAEVKMGQKDRRGYNVIIAKADEDNWAQDSAEPVADPIAPSGVTVQDVAGDPWTAAEAGVAACPVPAASQVVNAPQTDTDGIPRLSDPFAVGDMGYDF